MLPVQTKRMRRGGGVVTAFIIADGSALDLRTRDRYASCAMKRALVLMDMENLALSVIRTLGSRGFAVAVAGTGSGALVRSSRRCASYARVAADAAEMSRAGAAVVDAAERAARAFGADLIVPADVPGAHLAARLKERLPGVPFYPSAEPGVLDMLDDKWSFYELLLREGLPTPRTRRLADAAAAAGVAAPVVIKPLADSGGRGVAVARTADELAARLDGAEYPLLAQDFVDGEDVDLSFLADRGRLLAWAVQIRSPDGTIRYIDDARILDLGRRLASATAYTGLAHVDMRYDGPARDRVLIIECNPRFWGTFSYTLGLGADFMALGIELARGQAPAAMERPPLGSSPSVRAAVGKLLRGGDLSADSFEHIRQKLADPGPELLKAGRRLFGIQQRGP